MGSYTKDVVLLIAVLLTYYVAKPMIFQRHTASPVSAPEETLEAPEELKDKCFITQQEWWTYEFCSHKKLRQFHVENGRVVQESVLGEYDAEATAAARESNLFDTLTDLRWKKPSPRYHPHIYTNGTKCDLTNEPRETEVRFECSDISEMAITVDELSPCKYALTIRCEEEIVW